MKSNLYRIVFILSLMATLSSLAWAGGGGDRVPLVWSGDDFVVARTNEDGLEFWPASHDEQPVSIFTRIVSHHLGADLFFGEFRISDIRVQPEFTHENGRPVFLAYQLSFYLEQKKLSYSQCKVIKNTINRILDAEMLTGPEPQMVCEELAVENLLGPDHYGRFSLRILGGKDKAELLSLDLRRKDDKSLEYRLPDQMIEATLAQLDHLFSKNADSLVANRDAADPVEASLVLKPSQVKMEYNGPLIPAKDIRDFSDQRSFDDKMKHMDIIATARERSREHGILSANTSRRFVTNTQAYSGRRHLKQMARNLFVDSLKDYLKERLKTALILEGLKDSSELAKIQNKEWQSVVALPALGPEQLLAHLLEGSKEDPSRVLLASTFIISPDPLSEKMLASGESESSAGVRVESSAGKSASATNDVRVEIVAASSATVSTGEVYVEPVRRDESTDVKGNDQQKKKSAAPQAAVVYSYGGSTFLYP